MLYNVTSHVDYLLLSAYIMETGFWRKFRED